ncbi:MICAL-like protein [Phytophthora cinnamomi]|uniref:MICAL-like protein n=1 Tax=Phytophthora cinnamomi TaxID=4785 RepID=UPI0035598F9B|nr:MICAL-like protein [Phytophthora cinnamomi]
MDDRLSEIRNEQKILDYLAIDAGEKYLDDIYREDEGGNSTDGEDGAFYSNEPRRSVRQPSIPYTSAPLSGSGRGMGINSTEIDTIQLSQIVAEEAERKQKARAEKELAWQKVRQLLIEEEEKASTGTVNSVHSVDEAASVHSEVADDSYGTVKLLDSLARSGVLILKFKRQLCVDAES